VDFDWTTFVLEVVNFLILVWLLKRFLYRPVLDVVARRQTAIAKTLADAEAARSEAARLLAEHEGRQRDWERERARLRQALDDELDALRSARHAALAREMADERVRESAARAREREVEQRELQSRAVQQADVFAARLLERCAGPELDARIAAVLLDDLEQLPAERREQLHQALATAGRLDVCSARPLEPQARERIEAAATTLAARTLKTVYTVDPALLAGLRLRAGAWELAADLAGELRAFAELRTHA